MHRRKLWLGKSLVSSREDRYSANQNKRHHHEPKNEWSFFCTGESFSLRPITGSMNYPYWPCTSTWGCRRHAFIFSPRLSFCFVFFCLHFTHLFLLVLPVWNLCVCLRWGVDGCTASPCIIQHAFLHYGSEAYANEAPGKVGGGLFP
jgi:hypothetical protein